MWMKLCVSMFPPTPNLTFISYNSAKVITTSGSCNGCIWSCLTASGPGGCIQLKVDSGETNNNTIAKD